MIGALNLSARHRAATWYVDHAANDSAGRSMQPVPRDRHRCELLPAVGLRVIGLVGAEDLTGCFAAKYDNLAVDIDA